MAETGSDRDSANGGAVSGALVGWSRQSSRHGVILTLQVVQSAAEYKDHKFHQVSVALNERQLRSMARDLARATRARGLPLAAPAPWYRRLWSSLMRLGGF